jgi:hypothetical protein
MTPTNGNGIPQELAGSGESRLAGALMDEATVGYLPSMPLESMWAGGTEMPTVTLRRDLEFMQYHPIVSTSLDYYRSGIAGAEFWGGPDERDPSNEEGKPISQDARVAAFVLAHCTKFWAGGMPLMQEGGYPYGWGAGEHVYREVQGMLCWSHLRDFHPTDVHVLTLGYQPVGIRVRNIRTPQYGLARRPSGYVTERAASGCGFTGEYGSGGGGSDDHTAGPHSGAHGESADLWFAEGRVPAKAAWYQHRPRFGRFYGRSQFIGAWLPWRMLGWRDGMDSVINAAVYRAGYKGPIVRHPREDMQTAQEGIPATRADGQGNRRRSARDVARQMVEWARAGAGFTISSENYTQAQGGGPKWGVEFPDHVMDVRPLVEAARWCEDRIMLGMGVPPELVKAGGTGSGYSGRSIPREAFLDQQQRVADAMLRAFVEQVLRPLVLWNFGDVPFSVYCKSLLKSQASDKQGEDQGGQGGQQGKQPGAPRGGGSGQQPNGSGPPQAPPQPKPAQPPQAQPGGRAMAMPTSTWANEERRERVLEIVRRVMKRAG